MFSPYLMIKLVRRSQAMRSKSAQDKPVINKENNIITHDQNKSKCRICLQFGEIPIFGNSDFPDISESVRTFADIKIKWEDQYPKQLCDACHKLLQAAVVFRATAQESDIILKQTIKQEINDEEGSDNNVPIFQNGDKTVSEKKKIKAFREHVKKKYLCKVCYEDFFSLNEYYDHVNTIEHKKQKKNPKIQCKMCNKTLRRYYFRQHLLLHKSEKINRVKCKICKQYYVRGQYKQHMASHNPVQISYICDICGRSFDKKSTYRSHLQTHSSEFPFECEYCPYKGRNMSLLNVHMRTHTGDYRYQCEECQAKFLTSSNLNRHMAKHKGRNVECEACKRKFYSKHELQQHYKVDHLGIKDYICTLCNKAFGYKNALKKHQLHVHKRQKFINGKGRMPAYLVAEKNQESSDVNEFITFENLGQ